MGLRSTRPLGLAWFLAMAPVAGAQSSGGMSFTQITRPVAEVTDPATIRFLLYELFIEPAQPASRLAVIDVTLNGYGPDDVIVTYPSAETFLIPEVVPDSVQRIMGSWVPDVEYRLDAGNLPADALAALIGSQADTTNRAEKAILYDVVQAVERNYRDLPLGILYERDSVGFTFQMWDYNPVEMRYVPRPAFNSDSTVQSVLETLKDVGYLPGQSAASGGAVLNRPPGGITSVADVLLGIRGVREEQTRQMAARTVLMGSFDFDRSGAIDTPREVDAVSCDVWAALDATFPRFLYRLGFTDPTGPYFGSMLFGFSEIVRDPAAARGLACLEDRPPPESVASGAPAARPAVLPAAVATFLPMEVAAEVVRSVGSAEAGSATWAAAVRTVLVGRFDANASGMVDMPAEVDAIPCQVWHAVVATHASFVDGLGFTDSTRYMGDRIGIAAGLRQRVADRLRACAPGTERVAARPVPARGPPVPRARAGSANSSAVASALANLAAVPVEQDRQITTQTILLWLDFDRSGRIDTADELDAMSCDVWSALDRAFPGFADGFGFIADGTGEPRPYLGSIVFNISVRLRIPAGRRAAACLRGEPPPPTRPEDVAEPAYVIRLPVALEQFLQTETAGRIARAVVRLEPGSAVWASSVRAILLDEYDLDRSGMLDAPVEIDAVPCVVWQTIEATYQHPLSGLGLGPTGQYVGDQIGIAEAERLRVGRRVLVCGG